MASAAGPSASFSRRLSLSSGVYVCNPATRRCVALKQVSLDGSPFLVAFDTEAEIFRSISRPVMSGEVSLIEMNGSLALCNISKRGLLIDFWALEDYEAEHWEFKYQINLSVMVAVPPLHINTNNAFLVHYSPRAAVLNEREVLINFHGHVFICDINVKFLGDVKSDDERHSMQITWHWHKESIVPLLDMQENNELVMPLLLLGF